MQISDEELIAYLLGDANLQLRSRIESQLATKPELVERLSELRMMLGQLDSLHVTYSPPIDLVARTMARCDALGDEAADSKETPKVSPALSENVRLSATSEHRSRRTSWDSAALAICTAVLLSLFLPTVLRARYESRKFQCARNMALVGQGLITFASHDPQQRFPTLDAEGPESFAGIYALRLSNAGLLDTPVQVLCASLQGCRPFEEERVDFRVFPTSAEFRSMDAPRLERCKKLLGGDYAYNLGISSDGKYVTAPRLEGRSHFAILADSPPMKNASNQWLTHDGRGINIFFEDGHVAFVKIEDLCNALGDDPFCNLKQAREVGLSKQDASLGPSYFGPFGNDLRQMLIDPAGY
jgi:prepilin-type processing-associated H-X9-DG protein